MDFLTILILTICTSFLYLYYSIKKAHLFFEKLKIPYLKPNLIFGNMTDVMLLRKSLAEAYRDQYNALEPHRFGGVFTMKKPVIIVRDPELIRDIMIKDFAYFTDRGINTHKSIEPLSQHLFMLKGSTWRNLRIKLTTTFTSGKMKMMFPLLEKCGEKLTQVIDNMSDERSFNAKDLFVRYTTDGIATCAFGLETNSLENPKSEFRAMASKAFEFRYKALLRTLWPSMPYSLVRFFNISLTDPQVQKFYLDIVDKTVTYREQNDVTRNDFLDLLIALKNNTMMQKFHDTGDHEDLQKFLAQIGHKTVKSDLEMTNDLLAAQAFLFLAAGQDTTSTTLCYALLELCLNPTIQEKVRQEIHQVLADNDDTLTYDILKQFTYLEMVISETLRKYPPAAMLFRHSKDNYKVPHSDVVIPANLSIIIPVFGLHMDEKYYDNPEEFRPERFTEQEIAKRPHFTYLPFGDGPRVCIAERFAMMNMKIGLVHALKDFSYRVSPEMKFPLQFEKNFGLLNPKDSVRLLRQRIGT
uniref:Cytochrome P450 6PZ11 short isoform n=1 Tax=Maconellicoccus hirsutus TaxID=177089 RepID=A0AAT9UTP5_MACHI